MSTRRGIRTRPTSWRGSTTTSWPLGCRPRRSARSISPPSLGRSASSTASTTTSPAPSERNASSRRLVERGVRFVQVYCNDEWDAHNDLKGNHGKRCLETDKPIAGLLADLKQRGLLESTLIVWGGEFGRMPVSEKGDGRDHNPNGFLVWMAGGGVKGGASHGETDEIGWKAASHATSVHDLHATILHLLGMDHKRLTYLHNGRRFRLTDTEGEVISSVLLYAPLPAPSGSRRGRTLSKPGRDNAPHFFEAFGRAVLGQVVSLVPERIVEIDQIDGGDAHLVEREVIVQHLAAFPLLERLRLERHRRPTRPD